MKHVDVIYGNCGFRVARHKQGLLHDFYTKGFRVEMVDGNDKGSALDAVSGSVFFSEPLAIFVTQPLKDPEGMEDLVQHTGDSLRAVLIQDGNIPKSSKLFKKVVGKNSRVHTYNTPTKPWEQTPYAADFGVSVAKGMGTPISKSLATSLVGRVGVDLATIWWEVKKASMLAELEGSPTIEATHVKRTMAPIAEVGPEALIPPLEAVSAKKFLATAFRVQQYAGKDPTMWASALISKRVLLWLAVAYAHENKISLDLVAQRLGKNSWYIKNQVLPPARRWGSKGCASLLSALSEAENSVRAGAGAPFSGLVCGVLQAIHERRGVGRHSIDP